MTTRDVTVDLPNEYLDARSLIDTKHEEEALCWLWAFPAIFPWRKPIAWLYTPVVGNNRWPGDLWGIDTEGDLLVIEAKHCRRNDDPFADFIAFHKPFREELSSAHWQQKWANHLSAELSFSDGSSERPIGKTGGMLPRSNKRSHLRGWQALSARIDQQIRSRKYAESVTRNLNARAKSNDPTPFYIALMMQTNANHPLLSETAQASARLLQECVGTSHVVVVAIHCERLLNGKGRIQARTVDLMG